MRLGSLLLAGLLALGTRPGAAAAQQGRVGVVDSANTRLRVQPKRKAVAPELRTGAGKQELPAKGKRAAPTVLPAGISAQSHVVVGARPASDSMRAPPPPMRRAPKPRKGG